MWYYCSRSITMSGGPMQSYATLICSSCEHEFPVRLPPLYEELPECPYCGGSTQLHYLLRRESDLLAPKA